MAITTTMVVDLSSNEATGTVLVDGTMIETLIYDNGSNTVNLVEKGAMNISISDFIGLLKFYIVFNNAVIASFLPVNQFTYTPFTPVDQQLDNNGIDTLTFTFEYTPIDSLPLFQWVCTYPNGTVYVQKRSPASDLSYAQFLYFLYQAANFRLFTTNAYAL